MRYAKYCLAILAALLLSVAGAAQAAEKEFVVPVDRDGVQRAEIVGGSYFFNPNYLVVTRNVPIELKVRKEPGMVPHDFVLQAPDGSLNIKVSLATEPNVVRFTPTKSGKYLFYCDKKLLFLESHRAKGMEGTIEVRE